MIIQIGTEADESRILWKHSEADEWQRADIDDLIDAYESRPTGEWVRKYDKQINCYWYECNQCGEYRPRNVLGKEWSSPYCPNCGAIMYKGGDSDG